MISPGLSTESSSLGACPTLTFLLRRTAMSDRLLVRERYVAWTFEACQTQCTGESRKTSAIFCPHFGRHFSRNWLCFLCFKSESHSRSILKKATPRRKGRTMQRPLDNQHIIEI